MFMSPVNPIHAIAQYLTAVYHARLGKKPTDDDYPLVCKPEDIVIKKVMTKYFEALNEWKEKGEGGKFHWYGAGETMNDKIFSEIVNVLNDTPYKIVEKMWMNFHNRAAHQAYPKYRSVKVKVGNEYLDTFETVVPVMREYMQTIPPPRF